MHLIVIVFGLVVFFKAISLSWNIKSRVDPAGVADNELDNNIVIIHFCTNTFGKGMNPLYAHILVENNQ